MAEIWPAYDEYQGKTDREIPVVVLERSRMTRVAEQLAAWAAGLEPSDDDLALARRSLVDTVAVAIAARAHPIGDLLGELSEAEAWAVLAHVLDFDDLHMESTSHVSAVCVPAVLATGGDARAYLAGAGRHGPPGHRAGLAALRGGLARDLHRRRSRRGGRRRGRARARRRGGRHGDGARGAGGRRRAARVRHGGQGAAGRGGGAGRRARRAAGGRRRVGRSARAGPVARAGGRRRRSGSRSTAPPSPAGWRSSSSPAATRCSARSRRCARSTLATSIRAGRARGGAHAAERARPAHPRRADDRPGGQVQPAVRGRRHAARRPARDRELHRRGRRPARGAGAPGARRGRRRARAATGCWPATSAIELDARRRLDAARATRPAARRARPPAVDRPSWPRRWPTARATWPTRSSRSTGLDAGALLRWRRAPHRPPRSASRG